MHPWKRPGRGRRTWSAETDCGTGTSTGHQDSDGWASLSFLAEEIAELGTVVGATES